VRLQHISELILNLGNGQASDFEGTDHGVGNVTIGAYYQFKGKVGMVFDPDEEFVTGAKGVG
jgi:hypothetical protein